MQNPGSLNFLGTYPTTTVTPFTYREGATMLHIMEKFKNWAIGLGPEVQAIVDEALAQVEEKYTEWDLRFDTFMADVVAQLEALNDQAVTNLANNMNSLLGKALRENFALRTARNPLNYTGTATQRLIAAVTDANTGSVPVEVSEDLSITANVPNFWAVFPEGKGSITREGYTFELNPRPNPTVHTNNIFVNAQAGLDTNDGLSPVHAFKTIGAAYTQVLRRLTSEQVFGAKWVVNLKGQFEGGTTFSELPQTWPHTLVFQGEPVAPGGPVTKISKGVSSSSIGMWFEPNPQGVVVNNVWFDGFMVGFNGYGLLAKTGGHIRVGNCYATNCDIGFASINNVVYSMTDTVSDETVSTGFSAQYNSSGNWIRCEALGSPATGFSVSRNTVAHIDYCNIHDCGIGVVVDMASRVNVLEGDFKRNQLGVVTRGAGEWIDASSNFHIGTVNANINNYRNEGVGRETRLYSQGTNNEFHIGDSWLANPTYMEPVIVGGSIEPVTVYNGSGLGVVPADFFQNRDKVLRFVITGRAISATYATEVIIYVLNRDATGLVSLVQALVPAGTTGAFRIEFEVRAKGRNLQLASSSAVGAGSVSNAFTYDKSVNFETERIFRVTATPADASVNVEFHTFDTYLRG